MAVETSFDAAHFLPGYKGPCSRLHGHTYRVRLIYQGEIDGGTNMVIDMSELKADLRKITDEWDHRYLNDSLVMPTAENLAVLVLNHLPPRVGSYTVRVWETPTSFAEASNE